MDYKHKGVQVTISSICICHRVSLVFVLWVPDEEVIISAVLFKLSVTLSILKEVTVVTVMSLSLQFFSFFLFLFEYVYHNVGHLIDDKQPKKSNTDICNYHCSNPV